MKTLIVLFAMLAANFCVAQTLVDAPAPHAFLDKTNTLTLATAAVSIGLDGFSTQQFQRWGHPEMNPIARPFVKGRLGDSLYMAGGYSLLASAMYITHRKGWHRVERWLPVTVSGVETFWTWHNLALGKPHGPAGPITAGIGQVSRH